MIDEEKLRQGLQKLLDGTTLAIRERLTDEPILEAQLRARHGAAVQAARTESSTKGYIAFAEDAITQAAVHWLLGCVFVRFLEDNGWLDERNLKVAWISGPTERLAIAKDRRTLFLRPDPGLTDRDYLLHVFTEVAKLPGVAGLFDPKHNPLFSLQPTAQGAARIVQFFQSVDPDSNEFIYDFTDIHHSTRFLGDLYQNLSKSARKRYALCQTPDFVIDFILDRTLSPAIDEFGLEKVLLIDPSCGSGHFLLAAFVRLVKCWQDREPATNVTALVQRSLSAVHGVDLNPFAVAITRFRLLIAALQSSGISRLRESPDFRTSLATGDALLHGRPIGREQPTTRRLGNDPSEFYFATEDAAELREILTNRYTVVVGNPPYIGVQDSVLRELYRERYSSCQGKYQLSAPFFERFFNLARPNEGAGFVGMLTSNAFMRRSFGQVLIERFIARLDMQYIVDTSKAHIPDHGTPTVIMIGRNRAPSTQIVRVIRGIRGESRKPDNPSEAPVWRAIVNQIDQKGSESQWVSASDVERETLGQHPWAMGGGGAAELKAELDKVGVKLGTIVNSIGITSFTLLDEAYLMSAAVARRHRIPERLVRRMVAGDALKDWVDHTWADVAVFPYDSDLNPITEEDANISLGSMWPLRTSLAGGFLFGQKTKIEGGLKWFEFGRLTAWKLKTPLSISFGNVVTHNHFVLDRGGKVFNSHAPVIKLAPNANEDEHLELLGLLNSSTACFWLKQVCHNKGGGGIGGGLATELWEQFYDLNATPINAFPVPNERPLVLTRKIQREAEGFSFNLPERACSREIPSVRNMNDARELAETKLGSLISLQEELDWKVYQLYGLLDEHDSFSAVDPPLLKKGERAFEIIMAREIENGELETEWFKRHGAEQITELPAHWPKEYKELVERRIALIGSSRSIALIERPEYKRRWNLSPWQEMVSVALRCWLLDRIEANPIWESHRLVSCAQLRDALSLDREWISVADLYQTGPVEDLESFLIALATPEAVPFMPHLRYSETGLRKYGEWEEVWKLQREQDAGNAVDIPVPSKYVSKDFKKSDYWRLRGGLDVPKERFIFYPFLERDSDRTPVLGWAGWTHLEQARALAAYYQRMRTEEGWEPERLKPILAGLLNLREWLKQWHDDVDPETGLKLGTYFSEFAEAQCQETGFSVQEVITWQSVGTPTGRKKKSKAQ